MNKLIVLFLFALFACQFVAAQRLDPNAEWEFFIRLNNERQARNLAPMQMSSSVLDVARRWSLSQASRNTLQHNPNLKSQITSAAPGWSRYGENVGTGANAGQVHDLFMKSDGHRANILGDFNYVGIGVYWSGNVLYVTVDFVKKSGGIAVVPTPCCFVFGAIGAKYNSGFASALGYPTTNELVTPDKKGRFNHFQRGSIYWTPATDAHVVMGAIKETWAALGWENGPLGYPTTDETVTPNRDGRYNHFEHGSIYWTSSTGAHEVRGSIRNYWANLGWERSYLGYPTSNEYAVAGGRRSDFQHGSLFWNSATGQVTPV